MITDADMLKQIMVKDFNNFMDHAVNDFSLRLSIITYVYIL